MDPNECLESIRDMAAEALKHPMSEASAYDLAERVLALDEWLGRGGFLPRDWNVQASAGYPRLDRPDGT